MEYAMKTDFLKFTHAFSLFISKSYITSGSCASNVKIYVMVCVIATCIDITTLPISSVR